MLFFAGLDCILEETGWIIVALRSFGMRSSVIDARRVERNGTSHVGAIPLSTTRPPTARPPSAPTKSIAKKVPAPEEGWLALLLLAVAVYSVVLAIVDAHWVPQSQILLWSPVVGLLLGLLVAKLPRVPQALLHLAACLVGHWFSVWLTAVVAFHVSWFVLLASIKAVLLGGMGALASPNTNVIFFFYLTFLCFFLSYFGCWLVYRAHLPWLVALVYGSIMLVNLYSYTQKDLSYLLVILLAAVLLLIARVQLVAQIVQWKQEGLYTNSAWLHTLTTRCMRIASALVLITLVAAWLLPLHNQPTPRGGFWDSMNNVWNNLSNGNISLHDPASLLQPYQQAANLFGDQLTISNSVHLPTGEVLEYTSSNGPQYLEAMTLDQFDGHTWTTLVDSSSQQSFAPNEPIPPDVVRSDDMHVVTNIVIQQPPISSKNFIFAPPQPSSFTKPVAIYSNGMATAWLQRSPLVAGERYTVTSTQVTANEQSLMEVPLPTADPTFWNNDANASILKVYYEAVPLSISQSATVLQTMHQWTAGANNTYTALKDLEQHLSDTHVFTYSTDNPPIPANTDVVDWLLKTHSGYCTYYASAMIMMARMLNIPTRMVNGFAHGHYDVQHKVWVVDGTDAHSWVQAYFPGYGWIDFDPTPGFSFPTPVTPPQSPSPTPTPHPLQPTPTTAPKSGPTPGATPPTTSKNRPTGTFSARNVFMVSMPVLEAISIGALLISLLFFLFALIVHWWRNLYASSSRVSGLFWRLCWMASCVGLAPRLSQTPYEYSQVLSQQFPERAGALHYLTDLFVRDRWGAPQHLPRAQEEAHAEQLWGNLRGIFVEMILHKVKRKA
jgi:hypothetical protein